MNDEHGDETTCGDGNAEDAQHESSRTACSEPKAEATTKPTLDPVSDGALGAPMSPAPGPSISGAVSQPTISPRAAAHRPTSACSSSSTTATIRGVPPTALSKPTRRVCSAIRPPTRTATLAIAKRASSQLPVERTV